MGETDNKKPANNTTDNIKSIILYALAVAAALGFNDFILAIFDSLKLKTGGVLLSKLLYVFFIFGLAITFAYYTKSNVPI